MPQLRFDLVEGRSSGELKALLDAAHGALVTAFGVPERHCYQIVSEHAMSHFIVQDTGLGIGRTRNCVVAWVTSRPRSEHNKVLFYKELCERPERACDIKPSDLVVSNVTNTDEDWSFGGGRA